MNIVKRIFFAAVFFCAAPAFAQGPLPPPVNFTATAAEESIDLAWASPPGIVLADITGYKIRWALAADPTVYLNDNGATGLEVESPISLDSNVTLSIDDLTAGAAYDVQVAAYLRVSAQIEEIGDWTRVQTVTPLFDPGDTRLASLQIYGEHNQRKHALSPAFAADTRAYKIAVSEGLNAVNILATPQNPDASFQINGAPAVNGVPNLVELGAYSNGSIFTYRLTVNPADGGTAESYTISVEEILLTDDSPVDIEIKLQVVSNVLGNTDAPYRSPFPTSSTFLPLAKVYQPAGGSPNVVHEGYIDYSVNQVRLVLPQLPTGVTKVRFGQVADPNYDLSAIPGANLIGDPAAPPAAQQSDAFSLGAGALGLYYVEATLDPNIIQHTVFCGANACMYFYVRLYRAPAPTVGDATRESRLNQFQVSGYLNEAASDGTGPNARFAGDTVPVEISPPFHPDVFHYTITAPGAVNFLRMDTYVIRQLAVVNLANDDLGTCHTFTTYSGTSSNIGRRWLPDPDGHCWSWANEWVASTMGPLPLDAESTLTMSTVPRCVSGLSDGCGGSAINQDISTVFKNYTFDVTRSSKLSVHRFASVAASVGAVRQGGSGAAAGDALELRPPFRPDIYEYTIIAPGAASAVNLTYTALTNPAAEWTALTTYTALTGDAADGSVSYANATARSVTAGNLAAGGEKRFGLRIGGDVTVTIADPDYIVYNNQAPNDHINANLEFGAGFYRRDVKGAPSSSTTTITTETRSLSGEYFFTITSAESVPGAPGTPGAPVAPVLSAAAGAVVMAYTAPAQNGGGVTSYRARWRYGDDWVDGTGIDGVDIGLQNPYRIDHHMHVSKELHVEVAAYSAAGAGAWSPASSATPLSLVPAVTFAPGVDERGLPTLTVSWPNLAVTNPGLQGLSLGEDGFQAYGVQIKTADDNWSLLQLGFDRVPDGVTTGEKQISDDKTKVTQVFSRFDKTAEYDARAFYRVLTDFTMPVFSTPVVVFSEPQRFDFTPPPSPALAQLPTSGNESLNIAILHAADAAPPIPAYKLRWRLADADGSGSGTDPGAWLKNTGETSDRLDGDIINVNNQQVDTVYTIIRKLTNDTEYEVQVATVNAFARQSEWSRAYPGTPSLDSVALTSLKITNAADTATYALTPAFAPDVTAYTVAEVARTVTQVIYTAAAQSMGARIYGNGIAQSVDVGENVLEVVVLAPSGTARRVYRVTVPRASAVPGAPQLSAPTPGDSKLDLAWQAPSDTGGTAITQYRVRWAAAGSEEWLNAGEDVGGQAASPALGLPVAGSPPTLEYAITELDNGVTYDAYLRAVNSDGAGAWAKQTAAPVGPPPPPQNVRALTDDAELTLVWDAPVSNGGAEITTYRYRLSTSAPHTTWNSLGGADGVPLDLTDDLSGALRYVLSPLSNGELHALAVAAENSHGTGRWSESVLQVPSAQPPAAPMVQVTAAAGQLRLRWDAVDGVGSYVYRVRTSTAATFPPALAVASGTAQTIGDLENGTTYDAQVASKNPSGDVSWSTMHSAAPWTYDVDGESNLTAADGLLIARYLLGVRGQPLTAGASAEPPATVERTLSAARDAGALDADGNSTTDWRDGIIFARFLLGITGDALTENVSTRPSAGVQSSLGTALGR